MQLKVTLLALLCSTFLSAQSNLILHFPISPSTINTTDHVLYDASDNNHHATIFGNIFYDDDSFGNVDEALMTGEYGDLKYFRVDEALFPSIEVNSFTLSFLSIHTGASSISHEQYIAPIFSFGNENDDEFFIGFDKESNFFTIQNRVEGALIVDEVIEGYTFNPFSWEHFAFVYDAEESSLKFYVNAELKYEYNGLIVFPQAPQLDISIKDDKPMIDMNLCYDEIQLYNHAVSAQDIGVLTQGLTNVDFVISEELHVFPNPVNSGGTIQIEGIDRAMVQILDTKGSLVKKMRLESNRINVGDLSTGTYFLQLLVDDQLQTQKLIVK